MVREDTHGFEHGTAFLRPATTTRGMCKECAAHWWLMSVDSIRWGVAEASDGLGVLAYPNVQAALNKVLGLMHPELAGCDWQRLIAQKDLPWPDDWALPVDVNWEDMGKAAQAGAG